MWVTQQLLVPSDFFFLSTIKVSGDQQLLDYPHSSKYLLLCSGQDHKLIQVWYNMTASK